jgi:hypothetical protein
MIRHLELDAAPRLTSKEQSAKRSTNDFFLDEFSPETPADR